MYTVKSNQTKLHPHLEKVVLKHNTSTFYKPYSKHTLKIKESIISQLTNSSLILDIGPGKGTSSFMLLEEFPSSTIVGIDRSIDRLKKNAHFKEGARGTLLQKERLLLFQGDFIDWVRVFKKEEIYFEKVFILYPNPYPKSCHLMRRIHGHPIFPQLISITKEVEVRSNWLLYLEEFAFACKILNKNNQRLEPIDIKVPLTHFEAKYFYSNETCYKLNVCL
jgi:tRNA (guanine-N7-)-methyltransferase